MGDENSEKNNSNQKQLPSSFIENFTSPDQEQTIDLRSSGNIALPKDKIGHYQLISEIGRGGMGCVYHAHDTKLNRHVALKLLVASSSEDDSMVKRFSREAKAIAVLKHPNVINIYEVGQDGPYHYYTMDLIKGLSLKDYLKKKSPGIRHIVEIMAKVGKAVEFAHSKGIIHRDLKPANVMIGEDGEPRVMDFGLAKISQASRDLSKTGMIMGTLQYMPPEQANGKTRDIDERSDVYALGATLYELLSKRPPFHAGTSAQILYQILNEAPKPPMQIKKLVPKELSDVCMKALAKQKSQRYQSAKEFVSDLSKFSHRGKVTTRSNSKQNYLIWGGCAIAVILLVFILAKATPGKDHKKIVYKPKNKKIVKDTPVDREKAQKYFSKSIEQYLLKKHSAAWENLQMAISFFPGEVYIGQKAIMLFRGEGCERDQEQAKILLKSQKQKLYQNSDPFSLYLKGCFYLYAIEAEKDEKRAREIFTEAAKKGNPFAMFYLARAFYKGFGGPKNRQQAIRWYVKSANQGYIVSILRLGNIYRDSGNYSKALKWYKIAEEKGNEKAISDIGNLHVMYGKYDLGFKKLTIAEKLGYHEGTFGLGYYYYKHNDFIRAVEYYKRAAEQGNLIAMNNLATLYCQGKGVKRDYQHAIKWYKRAIDKGKFGSACLHLGNMYAQGWGMPRNFKKALEYLLVADKKNIRGAAMMIGEIYAIGGLGVIRDKQKAIQYYHKAVQRGNPQARKKLNALRKS